MKEFGGLKSELIQPKNNAVSELDITTCEVAKAPYFFVDLYTHTTWIVWTNSMNNIKDDYVYHYAWICFQWTPLM